MKRNQIRLNDRGIEKNKAFLKALYEADWQEENIWFDKLDCSVSSLRQRDYEMTLDIFLNLMDKTFWATLQICSVFEKEIRFCIRCDNWKGADIFVWLECPCVPENYNKLSQIFKEVYGQDLESVLS